MFDDFRPRYVPEKMLTVNGEFPVLRFKAFPPGTHPEKCPLVPSVTALCCETAGGNRWFGVARAYINSELRMVVEGINSKDEVRRLWKVVKKV